MEGLRPPEVPDLPRSTMNPSSISSPMSLVAVGTDAPMASLMEAMLCSPRSMQRNRMFFFKREFLLSFLSRKVSLIRFSFFRGKFKKFLVNLQIFKNIFILIRA